MRAAAHRAGWRSIERWNADDQLAGGAFKEARSHVATDLGERSNQCELAPALGTVRLILVFVAGVIHGRVGIAEMELKGTPEESGKKQIRTPQKNQDPAKIRPLPAPRIRTVDNSTHVRDGTCLLLQPKTDSRSWSAECGSSEASS